jgi:hypothetical protein
MEIEPLRIDLFADAEIGLSVLSVTCDPCVVYDYKKCVEILMNTSALSLEQAEKRMEDKYLNVFLNSDTPIFVNLTKGTL